jgi:plasmid stability protein
MKGDELMSTMTLRGVDETIAGALKEKARREDTSVNAVMLRILKESLGIEKKKRTIVYNDLDHLAGTWSARDAAEFESATAVFEKVDEDMWK